MEIPIQHKSRLMYSLTGLCGVVDGHRDRRAGWACVDKLSRCEESVVSIRKETAPVSLNPHRPRDLDNC